ncbi:MAG: hypothetical protein U9R26_08965 [Campylobacterota bacterium]|nr:hypothetical protein [Campylobacterota bacterium]
MRSQIHRYELDAHFRDRFFKCRFFWTCLCCSKWCRSGRESEKIFITLSQLVFNPWISGFLLAAVLAAVMSTVDSQLLVSSSVLTRDIYHAIIHKKASDRELVWVGRATVILIAIIAWIISADKDSSVLKLVAYAWAGFGAAFGRLSY